MMKSKTRRKMYACGPMLKRI